MGLEIAVQIATIVTLLLTATALLFGLWSFGRQMNFQVFLAYNERYEKVIRVFPSGALESRLRYIVPKSSPVDAWEMKKP